MRKSKRVADIIIAIVVAVSVSSLVYVSTKPSEAVEIQEVETQTVTDNVTDTQPRTASASGKSLRDRLVAVYAIGWYLDKKTLKQLSLRTLYSVAPAGTKIDVTGRTKKELKSMFYIRKIDDVTWESMQGKSYHEGCPIKRSGLRRVRILYYGYNEKHYVGELIVNKKIAQDVRDIFRKLYMKKYQIKRVIPIDVYDGDDNKSMKKDNTSCFNYRTVAGTNNISNHGYGLAIDINPVENPYVVGDHISPRNGIAYADRSKNFPHKIDKNDLCYKLFHKAGFFWGGDWNYTKDYQHFQKTD